MAFPQIPIGEKKKKIEFWRRRKGTDKEKNRKTRILMHV